jgi:hypothetical protein
LISRRRIENRHRIIPDPVYSTFFLDRCGNAIEFKALDNPAML